MFVYAVLCGILIVPALSYPSQAPDKACVDMLPDHGNGPNRTQAAYNITATKYSLNGGDSIEVTVSANEGETFRGFLIQARDGHKPIGTFSVDASHPHIQLLHCGGVKASAVTHKKITPGSIKNVSFVWNAPPGFKGNVKFVGTIVKTVTEYWVNVGSSDVRVS